MLPSASASLYSGVIPKRGVLYTIHILGLFRRRAEAVGDLDLSVAVLVAVHLDLLYQELHQLAALFERFASVLFDLLGTLSERQEPRLGGLCRQLVIYFATDIGFDRSNQELEVLHLVLEVHEVDFKLFLVEMPLGVELDVPTLLGLLGGEASRKGSVALFEVLALDIFGQLYSDALKDLSWVLEKAPHVTPYQLFKPLRSPAHARVVGLEAFFTGGSISLGTVVVVAVPVRGRSPSRVERAAPFAPHEAPQEILPVRPAAREAPILL